MPVHDWTRVEAGIFHDFHVAWLPEIRKALNGGLLPEGFYALAEQHAGRTIADVLTLHASPANLEPLPPLATTGGTAVAEAPPRVRRRESLEAGTAGAAAECWRFATSAATAWSPCWRSYRRQTRTASRAWTILPPRPSMRSTPASIWSWWICFPPGPYDPQGMAGAVRQRLAGSDEADPLPAGEPLTLASYVAGPGVDIYLEHLAIGGVLPEMPLFLNLRALRQPAAGIDLQSRLSGHAGVLARRAGRQTAAGRLTFDAQEEDHWKARLEQLDLWLVSYPSDIE